MQFEPVIRVNLNKFKEYYGLEGRPDGYVFERYANQVILSSHQPGAFSVDDTLLNKVCVGGSNDMGLDGICIKLNGTLIKSKTDAEDILKINKHAANIEFIFLQSKYKEKFDSKEFSAFITGAKDFLSDTHYQPMNDSVKEWLEIKNYLLSDEIINRWIQSPPIVRLYYVVMGKWNDSPHIKASYSQFVDDISALNIYSDVNVQYVDTQMFIKICNDNDNYFSCTFNTVDSFALPEVSNVEDSLIVLISADQLLKVLDTGEGLIRKALFNDNVRDFQGDTTINEEVTNTIKNDPKSFILMNNGITIICDSMLPSNRKLKITNPKIVNGCQTCSLLFNAHKQDCDCSDVTILAKVIATDEDEEITNRIVKSTNRQNIVYDEAFEVTRNFHKDLESLFNALTQENKQYPLYYERRSKQYANMPSVTISQKANFSTVIQSFISIFLNQPFLGHRHPSVLLHLYKDKIFVNEQSKYPYYISSLIFSRIENKLRQGEYGVEYKAYKSHISLIFKLITCGQSPDINDEKSIDEYCKKIQGVVLSEDKFQKAYIQSVNKFKEIVEKWVQKKGEEYRYGIKDSQEFTRFLIAEMSQNISESPLGVNVKYRGAVIKIGLDRYGHYFGFISKNPDNIFFHSADNPNIKIQDLLYKKVLYDIIIDPITQKEKAISIELV